MSAGKTALSAVQAGVYGLLTANTALMAALTAGVSDHEVDVARLPGVLLGNWEETEDDTGGLQVRKVSGDLHILSSYAGLSEAYGLLDDIVALLRRVPMTLSGWVHEDTHYTGAVQLEASEVNGRLVQCVVAHIAVTVTEA